MSRIKDQYATIKKALELFRDSVDVVAQTYAEREQNAHNEYLKAKTSGKYTEAYLKELSEKKIDCADLIAKVENLRTKTKKITDAVLLEYKAMLDTYYKAPVDLGFSQTITALKIVGDIPTKADIEILSESAKGSYMAEKMLQSMANGITYTEDKVFLNDDGIAETRIETVKAPIIFRIPDISKSYEGLKNIKNQVNATIEKYSGANGEFASEFFPNSDHLDTAIIYASAEGIFNSNVQFAINSNLADFEEIADRIGYDEGAKYSAKKDFTRDDRDFIDNLIDEKFPSLAKGTIRSIARYQQKDIISLLLADDRYKDIMKAELEAEGLQVSEA